MEQIERQKHLDEDEVKCIVKQLLIGAGIVLAGLLYMGIAEVICNWLEH